MPDSKTSRALLPALIIVLATAFLILIVSLVGRNPQIQQITPQTIQPGQAVELQGRFFGSSVESIFLSDRRVPVSAILEWSDQTIRFRAAPDAQSGLLVVENDRGRSEGVLVQVAGRVPRLRSSVTRLPVIESISSDELMVGSLLTVSGRNFGALQRTSLVSFSWLAGDCETCAERLFYGRWSNNEIQVRVPSGISDGTITVSTPDGASNAYPYTVVFPSGVVQPVGQSEIGLQYDFSVGGVTLADDPSGPSTRRIMVRFPTPVHSPLQTDVRFVEGPESTYIFESVTAGFERRIVRTVFLQRSGARTRLLAGAPDEANEQQTTFAAFYTRDLPGLGLTTPAVQSAAATIPTRGRSNEQIAASAYELTIDLLTPVIGQAGNASSALESGYADHAGYANTMVALLRSAGVPARTVSGILVPGSRTTFLHAWVEYFVPAVGWVPADPYLGDGPYLPDAPLVEEPRVFYLGNLDSNRVAFSRGLDDFDPGVLRGIRFEPGLSFSQQSLFAQAGRGLAEVSFSLSTPRPIGLFLLD